jgi:two-component system phosphate regulon sensor histidine kinase PhoR
MTVFKKSLLALGLAALGFNAIIVISALAFMNSLYYEINIDRLGSTAKALMTAIGEDRIAEIFADNGSEQNINLPVSKDGIYRLTLVDSSGYVVWDSQVTDRLVNHLDREEIVAALEGRPASFRRNSISTGMKMIYYALPVLDRNNISIGAFRLSLTIPGLGAQVSPIIMPFIAFSVLLIVVAFLAIYIYSRSLGTSIGRLVSITQTGTSLLSGHEDVAPEFQSLENALRAMTVELNSRIEQAKAEGSRFEAILNGMSEAVFAMDSSLKLHVVNPRAREIFYLKDRDVKNLTLLEATHSTELVDAAKKTISANEALEIELTFRTGVEQNFQIFTAPLNGGGVVLVLQDITRLLKLERIRKDFVANVSHELRTPIQVVKGFSETLLDTAGELKGSEAKKIVHFIEIIQKNAGIMENLTNDLLILADLENSSSNGREMEELEISSLIDEAISSVELQAKRKQIEINTDCDKDLTAKIYGSFIIQALINLIDNGIKYSPAKSKIKVRAYCEREELLFEVRDKGIGIPAEHLERIFERFYRVDRARSREAGGTGLGLSIVRHIALLHKGKVEVESRTGDGSVFRIRIPLQNYP